MRSKMMTQFAPLTANVHDHRATGVIEQFIVEKIDKKADQRAIKTLWRFGQPDLPIREWPGRIPKMAMMRFYKRQHEFYCGVDRHAKIMHVCLVDQAGQTAPRGERCDSHRDQSQFMVNTLGSVPMSPVSPRRYSTSGPMGWKKAGTSNSMAVSI